jgi:hypothetical protein
MELDHAVIRILAAIERERDYPAEEEEWQSFAVAGRACDGHSDEKTANGHE